MSFRIEYIREEHWTSWNKFLEQYHPGVSIAHNPCLGKVLQNCYDWEPHNAVLLHNEMIVAVFPYLSISGKLVSMPHFSYGGILCHPDYGNSHDFFYKLICQEECFKNGKYKKLNTEIRSFDKFFPTVKSHKVCSFKTLPASKEEFYDSLKPNIRRKIRRASEQGVEVLIANGRGGDSGLVSELANESGSHFSINTVTDATTDSITSLLSEFYEVYSCNMHYLGSPALGMKFFKTLLEKYCNGKARIFVAKKDGKAIGASISLSYLNTTENIHFSSLRKMNSYYPSYLLHYEMMKQAISDGSTIYSFGRSTRDSGVHKYKQQWEVQDKTIYYNYTRNPGLSLRDLSILTTLWKKLPYTLHKKVGPYIAGRVY